jgi:hypothetical protein
MMKKTLCVSVIIFVTLVSNIVHSSTPPRAVSRDEAMDLVSAALPLETRRLPGFALDAGEGSAFPHFYTVSVTWAGPPYGGSVVIGFYFVDTSTGDVWNAVAECEELSTPALRKLQAKVRLRIGLSDSEYRKIKKKGPRCP